jgi:hypothetical protein
MLNRIRIKGHKSLVDVVEVQLSGKVLGINWGGIPISGSAEDDNGV